MITQVKIFMMAGRNCYDDRSTSSWLHVQNFMMAGRDFHNDKSIISFLL